MLSLPSLSLTRLPLRIANSGSYLRRQKQLRSSFRIRQPTCTRRQYFRIETKSPNASSSPEKSSLREDKPNVSVGEEKHNTSVKEQKMWNFGDQPLNVPGMGLPIDYELPPEERFLHGMNEWVQPDRLTVRELSMLRLMDALTDKPEWNKKVFDEKIIAKWREEALSMPLISERTWNWCLAELQDKARDFDKHGFILTLDTGARCAKSDTLIDANLQSQLNQAVRPLLERNNKDWHPNSNEQVLNLVHPSLFPLVYGRSRVLENERIRLPDSIEACGKGVVIPGGQQVREHHSRNGIGTMHRHSWSEDLKAWSNRFQWLPCEVEFVDQSGTDVRISSYINNLHPSHHQDLYAIIEKIISKSIPLWNAVLNEQDFFNQRHARTPLRILTYGHETDPPGLPQWSRDMQQPSSEVTRDEWVAKAMDYLSLPENPPFRWADEDDPEFMESIRDGTWVEKGLLYQVLEWKFNRIRQILHPEPGIASSYEDWKAGRVAAVVSSGRASDVLDHNYYNINLEEKFRKEGLQVIVKLASIELTPEKPEYEGGNWHLEGMLNEHIVATSIYYYDVSNTTESRISFRQEADINDYMMQYEQDDHGPLEKIFGTESLRQEPAVQELGDVSTPHGRLLCFPNTLQHSVQPFSLADRTQPGHRRFLVLWLVDPHYRIISTGNVPPQQRDWWEPHALEPVLANSGLPKELQDMVREETEDWHMSMDEAKALRLELMEERTQLMPGIESNFEQYNFCEH